MRRLSYLLPLCLVISGCDSCNDGGPASPTPTPATPTQIQGGGTVPPPTPTPEPETNPISTPTPGGSTSETPGTGGTATPDTPTPTEAPTPPDPDPLASLEVYPREATLEVGGDITLQVVGRTESGATESVTVNLWNSSNEDVATVDAAGVVTALATGETLITASGGGKTSSYVTIKVIETGKILVQVVDEAGAGIPEAKVYLGDTSQGLTDELGRIEITGEFTGPQTVTAVKSGFHYATLMEVKNRDLRIPLRVQAETTSFAGNVDFTQMDDVRNNELRIGLITRSVSENPLALDFNTIVGDFREVVLCGIPLDLPSNFVGVSPQCNIEITDYSVPGPQGDYAAFALVGDLPLSETLAVLQDPLFYQNLGDFMLQIGGEISSFSFDVMTDISLTSGAVTEGIDPVPDGLLSDSIVADVPLLPDGVDGDTPPLLFVVANMGETGFLPIGLAGGDDFVQIYHPPLEGALADRPISVVAMAARGGVGSDGPYAAVMADKEEGDSIVELPEFMNLVELGTVNLTTREFPFYPVSDATLYRSVFSFFRKKSDNIPELEWDVYQEVGVPPLPEPDPTPTEAPTEVATPRPGETPTEAPTAAATPFPPVTIESFLLRLPLIPGSPTLKDFDWEITAYDAPVGTFEGYAGTSGPNILESGQLLTRMSRNQIYRINK